MGRSLRGKWVDQKYQNLCLATFFSRFGLSMDRFDCFMPKSGFFQKSGCFSLRKTRMHSLFIFSWAICPEFWGSSEIHHHPCFRAFCNLTVVDQGKGLWGPDSSWCLFETETLTLTGRISLFNWLIFSMKHALHFATRLNSRDIQKCNWFWVPS